MDCRLYIWPRYVLKWAGQTVKLSNVEGVVMSRLAAGRPVSYFDITESLYEGREDGGPDDPDNVIAVTICRLRKKIKNLPIEISRARDKHVRLIDTIGVALDRVADEVLDD